MQKEGRNSAISRALAELRYTLIATSLVLILGLGFYLFLPYLGEVASAETKASGHKRAYAYFDWGAQIEYQALSAKAREKSTTRLKQDLEILARRFGRGNFTMLTLPGIQSSPKYQKIFKHHGSYEYKLEEKDRGAILKIRVRNKKAQAVKALHEYLRYLEKNWST